MIYRMIHADVIEGLRSLDDESVQCVVTSPPYWGLRNYGIEPSVWGGDDFEEPCPEACVHEWGEVLPPAKSGPGNRPGEFSTSSLTNPARQNAIHSVTGKSSNSGAFCILCGAWRGCLGLEPTPALYVEHVVTVFAEVWRVLRKDGTLWLNLGDSYANDGKWGGATGGKHVSALHGEPVGRAKRATGLKPKDLVGIPWRVAFALQEWGWWLRRDIIWSKPNPMPESVTDRPTTAHEYIFLLTKSERYFYDADAIREPVAREWSGERNGRRWTSGGAEGVVLGRAKEPHGGLAASGSTDGRRNRRSVWTIATQPFSGAHFATFPLEIPTTCILAGSRVGDRILDPFSGSGRTGVAALELGREYDGIERSAEYVAMSERHLRRVDAWQPSLLDHVVQSNPGDHAMEGE